MDQNFCDKSCSLKSRYNHQFLILAQSESFSEGRYSHVSSLDSFSFLFPSDGSAGALPVDGFSICFPQTCLGLRSWAKRTEGVEIEWIRVLIVVIIYLVSKLVKKYFRVSLKTISKIWTIISVLIVTASPNRDETQKIGTLKKVCAFHSTRNWNTIFCKSISPIQSVVEQPCIHLINHHEFLCFVSKIQDKERKRRKKCPGYMNVRLYSWVFWSE